MGESSPYRDMRSLARADSVVRRTKRQCNSDMEDAALGFVSSVLFLLEDKLKSYSPFDSMGRSRRSQSNSHRSYRRCRSSRASSRCRGRNSCRGSNKSHERSSIGSKSVYGSDDYSEHGGRDIEPYRRGRRRNQSNSHRSYKSRRQNRCRGRSSGRGDRRRETPSVGNESMFDYDDDCKWRGGSDIKVYSPYDRRGRRRSQSDSLRSNRYGNNRRSKEQNLTFPSNDSTHPSLLPPASTLPLLLPPASKPPYLLPPASTPSFLLPSASKPPYLLPPASTPSFLLPSASKPPFLLPPASTPSFLLPSASKPPFLLPPASTPSFLLSSASTPLYQHKDIQGQSNLQMNNFLRYSNPINNTYSGISAQQAQPVNIISLMGGKGGKRGIKEGNALRNSDVVSGQSNSHSSYWRYSSSRNHNSRHRSNGRCSRSHSRLGSRSGKSPSRASSKSYKRPKLDSPPKDLSNDHSGGSNNRPSSAKVSKDSKTPSGYSHNIIQGRKQNQDRSSDEYKSYKRLRVDSPSSLLNSPSLQGSPKSDVDNNSGGRGNILFGPSMSTSSGASYGSPLGSFSSTYMEDPEYQGGELNLISTCNSLTHPGEGGVSDLLSYGPKDKMSSLSDKERHGQSNLKGQGGGDVHEIRDRTNPSEILAEMKVARNNISLKHHKAKDGASMVNNIVVSEQSKGRDENDTSNKQACVEGIGEMPSVSKDSTHPLEGQSSDKNDSNKHRKRCKKSKHNTKTKEDELKAAKAKERTTYSPKVADNSSSAKGEYRRANNLHVGKCTALDEKERVQFKVLQAKKIGEPIKSQVKKHLLPEPAAKTEMGLTVPGHGSTAEGVMGNLDCKIKEEPISDDSN